MYKKMKSEDTVQRLENLLSLREVLSGTPAMPSPQKKGRRGRERGKKKICEWYYIPVDPDTQEAEVGASLTRS